MVAVRHLTTNRVFMLASHLVKFVHTTYLYIVRPATAPVGASRLASINSLRTMGGNTILIIIASHRLYDYMEDLGIWHVVGTWVRFSCTHV